MADYDIQQSSPKKLKLDENKDNSTETTDNVHNNLNDLSKFKSEKVLNLSTNRKSVCLQGTFAGKDGVGIVFLEKTAFSESELDVFFTKESSLEKIFSNDIYGNYKCFPKIALNGIDATIIHPATSKHLIKYSGQNLYLIEEAYDIYKEITLPHLENEQLGLKWVFNILDHISEKDRIVYEDPDSKVGFVLLPDLKWDGKTLETLYLIAIVREKNIKSLRDLTDEHLPLLKNIYEKGCEAIKEKYGLPASQLRIYLHYQPSFYHLHVHFTYLKHDAPGIYTERSHMLSNVISNITLLPDYYQKVTIPFVVRESDKLFKLLCDKNIIKPVEKYEQKCTKLL